MTKVRKKKSKNSARKSSSTDTGNVELQVKVDTSENISNKSDDTHDDHDDGTKGSKGSKFSALWAKRRRVRLDPEAPGYTVFQPNMQAPRSEAWGFGGDLLHYGYIYVSNYLWDLKEVAFFSAAIIVWIIERFESDLNERRKGENQVANSDQMYIQLGVCAVVLIICITVAVYVEFEKRKRMYYTYLLVDVFIDFENTEFYQYWRYRLCMLLSVVVIWSGWDEGDIISWHNADGLITIYGLMYFVGEQVDVEKALVPFSRIFEREDGRELIASGWKELTLVSEECIVVYFLYRAQQAREALKALKLRRKEAKVKPNPRFVHPWWQASKEDVVKFVAEEFVSVRDAETADKPSTQSLINGWWWRQSWYGTVVGWLVIGKSCVLGPYELKDKQNKYFHELSANNAVHGDAVVKKELRSIPIWSALQLQKMDSTVQAHDRYNKAKAKAKKRTGRKSRRRPARHEDGDDAAAASVPASPSTQSQNADDSYCVVM